MNSNKKTTEASVPTITAPTAKTPIKIGSGAVGVAAPSSVIEKEEDVITSLLPHICLALLVKQKETTLHLTLRSVDELDYPKDRISLYIRTNNNTDRTQELLEEWIEVHRTEYKDIFYDPSNVEEKVEDFEVHEWNAIRFKVLGKIRNESMKYAVTIKSDFYFVIDIDNCVIPETLRDLVALNLTIVAPLIRKCNDGDSYANFFTAIDANGYYAGSDAYAPILDRVIKGIIECPVVHCTYLIRTNVIKKLSYADGSDAYEFVIFSRSARRSGVPQYLDNRKQYGWLSLDEDVAKLSAKMGYDKVAKHRGGRKGSDLSGMNEKYRAYLQKFLADNKITSVVDFGCGLFDKSSSKIDWSKVDSYVGIVDDESTLTANKAFETDTIKFVFGNRLNANFKPDLIICKDTLQHLSIVSTNKLLEQFKRSSKFMLITNDIAVHTECNKSIEDGQWTPVKLDYAPYCEQAYDVLTYINGPATKGVYLMYGDL